jgi:DNA-binding NarL/FixJ family response regulator
LAVVTRAAYGCSPYSSFRRAARVFRFPLPDAVAALAIISAVVGNVLVVDDDPGFRSLAVRLLERTGLRVTGEADTVKRAREVVHEVRPTFVLLDVSLPDGDGVALAGELTELPWRPRVVLISSDRDAASAAALDQSGAAAFIPKDELTDNTLRIAFSVP